MIYAYSELKISFNEFVHIYIVRVYLGKICDKLLDNFSCLVFIFKRLFFISGFIRECLAFYKFLFKFFFKPTIKLFCFLEFRMFFLLNSRFIIQLQILLHMLVRYSDFYEVLSKNLISLSLVEWDGTSPCVHVNPFESSSFGLWLKLLCHFLANALRLSFLGHSHKAHPGSVILLY